MYEYSAYGLSIASEIALPELVPATGSAPVGDVTIRLGSVERYPANVPERRHHATPDDVYFYYEHSASYRVRRGVEVVVEPLRGGDEDLARAVLLGPVLATVLHQRGLLVLHASAVSFGGSASLFLGEKGYGKSTLALFLQARGHEFLTDDVVALDTRDPNEIRIYPGYPQLKLWPSSAACVGVDPEDLPRVQADLEKRCYRLDVDFSSRAVPVRRVYTLDLGERTELEPLAPRDALMALVRNTYLIRYLDATDTRARNLEQCVRVASLARVANLKRKPSLDLMDPIADLLERDADRVASVAG